MSRHLCRYRRTLQSLLSLLRKDRRNLKDLISTTRKPSWLVKDAKLRLSLTSQLLDLIPSILKEQA